MSLLVFPVVVELAQAAIGASGDKAPVMQINFKYYLVDGLKEKDTSDVCWIAVAAHLDNVLPLDYC